LIAYNSSQDGHFCRVVRMVIVKNSFGGVRDARVRA
jgi:hypothetical protein